MKKLLPILVLLPFTVFSVEVIVKYGYFGFLDVAWREPWGMQILIDLSIALFLVGGAIRRDAKKHGIPWVPYLVALPFLGSIAALAYLVHRAFKTSPAPLDSAKAQRVDASASRKLSAQVTAFER